jgi:hypothetical protein
MLMNHLFPRAPNPPIIIRDLLISVGEIIAGPFEALITRHYIGPSEGAYCTALENVPRKVARKLTNATDFGAY